MNVVKIYNTMITIKDILTELCKRGCMIEIKNGYPIDHLPKSLVTINDDIIDHRGCNCSGNCSIYCSKVEFRISPIVHNFSIYFAKGMKPTVYRSTWCAVVHNEYIGYITHYLDCLSDYKIIMENLDFLTHHLYTCGDNKQHTLYVIENGRYIQQAVSPDAIIPYTENLKVKMISSLINEGILRYLQAIDNIFPTEIKIILINMFIKLDNWHNIGFYMKYGT